MPELHGSERQLWICASNEHIFRKSPRDLKRLCRKRKVLYFIQTKILMIYISFFFLVGLVDKKVCKFIFFLSFLSFKILYNVIYLFQCGEIFWSEQFSVLRLFRNLFCSNTFQFIFHIVKVGTFLLCIHVSLIVLCRLFLKIIEL